MLAKLSSSFCHAQRSRYALSNMYRVVLTTIFVVLGFSTVPLVHVRAAAGWRSGFGHQTIIEKRCSNCGHVVPLSSHVGQRCPFCHVLWGSEIKHSKKVSLRSRQVKLQVHAQDSASVTALLKHGDLLLHQGDIDGAMANYSRSHTLRTDLAYPLYQMSIIAYLKDDRPTFRHCLRAYSKIVRDHQAKEDFDDRLAEFNDYGSDYWTKEAKSHDSTPSKHAHPWLFQDFDQNGVRPSPSPAQPSDTPQLRLPTLMDMATLAIDLQLAQWEGQDCQVNWLVGGFHRK